MSQPTSYPDHYRKLITLGVPIIIGQIGMIILGFADTIMIGTTARKNSAQPAS